MGAEQSSSGRRTKSSVKLKGMVGDSPDDKWKRYNEEELTLLDRMFQDLASRSPDKTMSKDTFLEYFNLPGILGERLFEVFDTKKNGVIEFEEFVIGLARYNKGTMEEKMDMLFDMYDLDGASKISKEELTVVLLSIITPTTSLFFDETSTGLIQDDDQLTHVSKVTRKLVSNMIEEAFKFAKTDADKKYLMRDEFHEWLASSPATIEMLETVLAKHLWSGMEDPRGASSSIMSTSPPQSTTSAGLGAPAAISGKSAATSSSSAIRRISGRSPRISGVAIPGSPAGRSASQLFPPAPGSPMTSSPRMSLPPSMLPMYSKMSELYMAASSKQTCLYFACEECKFEFYTTMHVEEISKSAMKTGPDTTSRYLVFRRTGTLSLSMNYCPECGHLLTKKTVQVEMSPMEEAVDSSDMARVLRSAAGVQSAADSQSTLAASMSGLLYKVQRKFKGKTSRYYVLKDKFIYGYRKKEDTVPSEALFIQGWFIRSVSDVKEEAKGFYPIELTPPSGGGTSGKVASVQIRYTKTKEERTSWVEALQRAASTVSFRDHFDIGRELGKGHFSVVHLGTHKKSGKEYAIKIIEKTKVDMREKEALRNEMAILKLVKHPCIINMIDVFEDTRMIYMVMPLIPHGDLFARWKTKPEKVFPESIAKMMIYKLLDAVKYLHSLGIVHRDLKPENILCLDETDDTKFVISDFGLSKFAAPHAEMTMPCGTLAYVAPEVISQQKYDWKVDIWSLGCIMHLLLRGVLPFDGHTKEDVIERTLRKKLVFTHAKWERVSQEAKDLLTHMLMKNPKERATIDEAIQHKWFDEVRDEMPVEETAEADAEILTKMLLTDAESDLPMDIGTLHRATSMLSALTPTMTSALEEEMQMFGATLAADEARGGITDGSTVIGRTTSATSSGSDTSR